MDKLIECRQKIDEIDTEIIELFEKRMKVVEEVINYKMENNYPILDSNRELVMLKINLSKIKNENFKKYYQFVLKGFLEASKLMQKDILDKKYNHK